jgi:hypothetical protein
MELKSLKRGTTFFIETSSEFQVDFELKFKEALRFEFG